MRAHELPHRLGSEDPARAGPFSQEQVLHRGPQGAPKPRGEGDEESHFAVLDHRLRQQALRVLPGDPFQDHRTDLQAPRDLRRELGDPVVQDGDPVLQGVGHRHPVLDDQQGG